MEQIIDHAAHGLGVSPENFREANIYREGQTTPYGDVMSPCYLEQLWNQLKESCEFERRSAEIAEFNRNNKYRKKGIAMMPLKYGFAFSNGFEYLVHVMINDNDGSVTVIHGGVEMGQGINTKAIQVAASTLGVPVDMVKVQPTSTVMNLHSGLTAASITSDMNCLAVKKACEDLLERLRPFKSEQDIDWLSLIKRSRAERLDLHANISKYNNIHLSNNLTTAFLRYVTNDLVRNKELQPNKVGFWLHNIYGTACSEVELDSLTGNYIVNRVDVLYDSGESYSPMIDLGQIEGAFVMGMGLYLYERIKYDPDTGRNITTNTWSYKVPMARDIPVEFNVQLTKNLPNDLYVFRSKAVGEPPLLLSESVVLALKKAVNEVRHANGNKEFLFIG